MHFEYLDKDSHELVVQVRSIQQYQPVDEAGKSRATFLSVVGAFDAMSVSGGVSCYHCQNDDCKFVQITYLVSYVFAQDYAANQMDQGKIVQARSIDR